MMLLLSAVTIDGLAAGKITLVPSSLGDITCDRSDAESGTTVTLTLTGKKDKDYTYKAKEAVITVQYDPSAASGRTRNDEIPLRQGVVKYDVQSTDDNVSVYTFTMPDGDVKVEATFEVVTVNEENVSNGTLTIENNDITDLGDAVFKPYGSDLKYIDLTSTKLDDVKIDRTSGAFQGVSEKTLIYLPSTASPATDSDLKNVILSDGTCTELLLAEDAIVPKAIKASKVTFDRDFVQNRYSTVFLPFSIPESEASQLGTFHLFQGISEGQAQFSEAVTGDIKAETPYVFIPKNNEKISVNQSVSIAITTGTDEKTNVNASGKLVGTFNEITFGTGAGQKSPANIYGFADDNNKGVGARTFVKVKAGATIAPFRAYLEVTGTAGARLEYSVSFGSDDTTGISTVKTDDDATWYSIDGRRLSGQPSTKGIYIKNGKKTVINK